LDYLELIIAGANPERSDELLYRLSEEGFESFIDIPGGFSGYIPLPLPAQEDAIKVRIAPILREFEVNGQWNVIKEKNWNEEWEKNYDSVLVAEKCHIRAPFHDSIPGIPFEIVIEPKMSFGTAHHETTSLMLEFILETDCAGKRILDMGCGTGVLAILACLKGAIDAIAIDNDEWSFLNTQENFGRNNIDHAKAVLGDVESLKGLEVDLIFANINRNILLDQIHAYSSILPNGELLMSGFYQDDLNAISKCAGEHGFALVKYLTKNNWVAAKFKK
jgi:ribosomal protein L11 methyltransferase